MLIRAFAGPGFLLLAACGGGEKQDERKGAGGNGLAAAPAPAALPPIAAEASAPPEEGSPQEGQAGDAAAALRTYYALIEAGDYDGAWALRWHGAADDAKSKAAFADHYSGYSDYRAQIGAPSEPAGAAGSLYVEIPVQIQGRTKEGEPFVSVGTVTMRRANDVPGATPEQRRWRVYSRG